MLNKPGFSPVPEARLVIHAAAAPAARGTLYTVPLEWLRGLYTSVPTKPDAPLRLHIDDLQGQRVFTADNAQALVELALPVGTYNVTAVLGTLCRGYTLTLVEGAQSDLYLCPSLCNGK